MYWNRCLSSSAHKGRHKRRAWLLEIPYRTIMGVKTPPKRLFDTKFPIKMEISPRRYKIPEIRCIPRVFWKFCIKIGKKVQKHPPGPPPDPPPPPPPPHPPPPPTPPPPHTNTQKH